MAPRIAGDAGCWARLSRRGWWGAAPRWHRLDGRGVQVLLFGGSLGGQLGSGVRLRVRSARRASTIYVHWRMVAQGLLTIWVGLIEQAWLQLRLKPRPAVFGPVGNAEVLFQEHDVHGSVQRLIGPPGWAHPPVHDAAVSRAHGDALLGCEALEEGV